MEGYIITLQPDNSQAIGYWTDTAITDNLEEAGFYTDLTVARRTAGTLQTQYTDRVVKAVPATKGIVLGAV